MREYLVVDPETERVLLDRLVDGRFQHVLGDRGRIRSDVIADFELDAPVMFAAIHLRLALVGGA